MLISTFTALCTVSHESQREERVIPGTPSILRAKNERKNPKPAGVSGAARRRCSREAAFALAMTALHRTPAAHASSRGSTGASSAARPPPGCAGPAARRGWEPGRARRAREEAPGPAPLPAAPGATRRLRGRARPRPPPAPLQPPARREAASPPLGKRRSGGSAPRTRLAAAGEAAGRPPEPPARRALTMAKPESSAEVRLEAFSLARLR